MWYPNVTFFIKILTKIEPEVIVGLILSDQKKFWLIMGSKRITCWPSKNFFYTPKKAKKKQHRIRILVRV